jgi:magnesium-transporting ATPase (P-type)
MTGERIRTKFWRLEDEDVFAAFESQPAGLTESEAADRLRSSGPNEIAEKEKRTGFRILLSQFANSFVLVLIGAAVIAWFLQDRTDSLVILVIVILSTLLGFFQEYRAERALRELKKFITMRATVMRDGALSVVETKRIVPGDVVVLEIGI